MDTQFWGPSGWRLLHMITFAYEPESQESAMRQFFEILPFVLPCKYCRSNLVKHYKELPLEPALKSKETLTKWLYEIHGLVNNILRKKGQKIPNDPPFSDVKRIYEERLHFGCSKTEFPGWEFLFSIVESHPLSKSEQPHPLPDAPPKTHLKTNKELLEWNYLSGTCRFNYVCRFWKLLPHVLPFSEWRRIWKQELAKCCGKPWDSKETSLRTLWKARKAIEEKLELLNKTTFHDLCKTLRYYKSGCGFQQNRNTRTCRRFKGTRKHRYH
jgi:hypothetical protein